MNKNQINFLQFRTELIELLDKYNCEIAGTNLDDGSIQVRGNKSGWLYLLRDADTRYEALDSDWNALPTDYILNMFPEKRASDFQLKTKVGIFTNNPYKASEILDDIYQQNKNNVIRYVRSGLGELNLLLNDGTYYVWVKPRDMSRGHRCSRAYIDKNLTLNELNELVVPICIYCSREDIVII